MSTFTSTPATSKGRIEASFGPPSNDPSGWDTWLGRPTWIVELALGGAGQWARICPKPRWDTESERWLFTSSSLILPRISPAVPTPRGTGQGNPRRPEEKITAAVLRDYYRLRRQPVSASMGYAHDGSRSGGAPSKLNRDLVKPGR